MSTFDLISDTLRSTFQLVVWFYCVSLDLVLFGFCCVFLSLSDPRSSWFSAAYLTHVCVEFFLSAHKVLYKKSYNEKSCKKIYFFLNYLKINVYGEKAFGLFGLVSAAASAGGSVWRNCEMTRTRREETQTASVSSTETSLHICTQWSYDDWDTLLRTSGSFTRSGAGGGFHKLFVISAAVVQ